MWPRWNTRPIVVPGFAAPPVKVVAGTRVAGKAPFIRALNTVAATIRFRSAVPDPAASALRVGRPHSVVATGRVGRPPGRSPPAPQAPLRPCACGARRPPRTVRAELAPLSGGLLRCGVAPLQAPPPPSHCWSLPAAARPFMPLPASPC